MTTTKARSSTISFCRWSFLIFGVYSAVTAMFSIVFGFGVREISRVVGVNEVDAIQIVPATLFLQTWGVLVLFAAAYVVFAALKIELSSATALVRYATIAGVLGQLPFIAVAIVSSVAHGDSVPTTRFGVTALFLAGSYEAWRLHARGKPAAVA